MVVPWSPGGDADTRARMIGARLALGLGRPVVIENRPGAGGALGAAVVARAPADGYIAALLHGQRTRPRPSRHAESRFRCGPRPGAGHSHRHRAYGAGGQSRTRSTHLARAERQGRHPRYRLDLRVPGRSPRCATPIASPVPRSSPTRRPNSAASSVPSRCAGRRWCTRRGSRPSDLLDPQVPLQPRLGVSISRFVQLYVLLSSLSSSCQALRRLPAAGQIRPESRKVGKSSR